MMYRDFDNAPLGRLVQIGKSLSATHNSALLSSYTLRISVLEQCHYRCLYCEPGVTKPFLSKKQWLTSEQHASLADAFASFPITKIRFTGGEPLLRRDLVDLIKVWRDKLPHTQMAMTTNGDKMAGQLEPLKKAGLNQLTFHLDTLKQERYARLMGPGNFQRVLEQLHASHRLFGTTKINMVVQKGLNLDEMVDFLHFSKASGIQVRFIELMDTGSAPTHVQQTFISQKEMLAFLRQNFEIHELPRHEKADPAALFHIPSLDVTFGMIASDTEPFCSDCNRLRLSADGTLRGCLYEPQGVALRDVLAKKLPRADLQAILKGAVLQKSAYHPAVGRSRVAFSMAQVGG